jgi:hypothetical protein
LTSFDFFGSVGLLKDETEAVLAVTEVVRRSILASFTSEAIFIYVKFPWNVLRVLFG